MKRYLVTKFYNGPVNGLKTHYFNDEGSYTPLLPVDVVLVQDAYTEFGDGYRQNYHKIDYVDYDYDPDNEKLGIYVDGDKYAYGYWVEVIGLTFADEDEWHRYRTLDNFLSYNEDHLYRVLWQREGTPAIDIDGWSGMRG